VGNLADQKVVAEAGTPGQEDRPATPVNAIASIATENDTVVTSTLYNNRIVPQHAVERN
jgi:hypothetical protein